MSTDCVEYPYYAQERHKEPMIGDIFRYTDFHNESGSTQDDPA